MRQERVSMRQGGMTNGTKKTQTRQGKANMSKQKKQHDKEKGNETSRKTQRHATMKDGRKTQYLLLSALPVFFEKAF